VNFRAVVEPGEAATVLALSGDLDMAAGPTAEARLREAFDGAPGRLVVDCSALTFIDSSGIRLLLQADASARSAGVDLTITRPPAGVWRLLERFDLHTRLPFADGPAAVVPPALPPDDAQDGIEREVELDAGLRAPAQGRAAVEAAARGLADELHDILLLLVSEVVTNAVRHGCLDPDDKVRLSLTRGGGAIRVEVEDPGPGIPEPMPGNDDGDDPLRESGWGLVLVNQLASRWGVARDPSRVWFELDV
jgi:anti-anti-sigma factor